MISTGGKNKKTNQKPSIVWWIWDESQGWVCKPMTLHPSSSWWTEQLCEAVFLKELQLDHPKHFRNMNGHF